MSDIFAWYSLIGNAGTALGMMTGGWAINLLQVIWGWPYIPACRVIFFAYAAIGALKFLLSIALSSAVEAEKKKPARQSTNEGERQPLLGDQTGNATPQEQQPQKKKSILSFLGDSEVVSLFLRLAILFGLDSFASGLASLYVSTQRLGNSFQLGPRIRIVR